MHHTSHLPKRCCNDVSPLFLGGFLRSIKLMTLHGGSGWQDAWWNEGRPAAKRKAKGDAKGKSQDRWCDLDQGSVGSGVCVCV
jgi:hypothetical protein